VLVTQTKRFKMIIIRNLDREDSYTLRVFGPNEISFTADEVYNDQSTIILNDKEIAQLIKDLKEMHRKINGS
jgi:hypothetical protein